MAVVRWKPGFFGWHRDPFREMDRLQMEINKLSHAFAGRRGIAANSRLCAVVRA
jgi:hypothetical protein